VEQGTRREVKTFLLIRRIARDYGSAAASSELNAPHTSKILGYNQPE
jgi:hypothetical protein